MLSFVCQRTGLHRNQGHNASSWSVVTLERSRSLTDLTGWILEKAKGISVTRTDSKMMTVSDKVHMQL